MHRSFDARRYNGRERERSPCHRNAVIPPRVGILAACSRASVVEFVVGTRAAWRSSQNRCAHSAQARRTRRAVRRGAHGEAGARARGRFDLGWARAPTGGALHENFASPSQSGANAEAGACRRSEIGGSHVACRDLAGRTRSRLFLGAATHSPRFGRQRLSGTWSRRSRRRRPGSPRRGSCPRRPPSRSGSRWRPSARPCPGGR